MSTTTDVIYGCSYKKANYTKEEKLEAEELTPDEEAFIEGVEFALDCCEKISPEDHAEYRRLIKKRADIERTKEIVFRK